MEEGDAVDIDAMQNMPTRECDWREDRAKVFGGGCGILVPVGETVFERVVYSDDTRQCPVAVALSRLPFFLPSCLADLPHLLCTAMEHLNTGTYDHVKSVDRGPVRTYDGKGMQNTKTR